MLATCHERTNRERLVFESLLRVLRAFAVVFLPATAMPRTPRILIYTDSRGELKPSFRDKPIFPEKIKAELAARGVAVDLLLCPFKWTTTLDLFELLDAGVVNLSRYDKVILYSGVVEWSPRPISSFKACMKGTTTTGIDVKALNSARRPPKVANHKLDFFRRFFGASTFNAHARTNLNIVYREELTKNLISLDMLRHRMIPHLQQTFGEKLIYINANRFVPGWEGDYTIKNPDGRPKNIGLIEDYAAIMSRHFPSCIDLAAWSDVQIKRFTVDNVHLTHAGSEWIYSQLIRRL